MSPRGRSKPVAPGSIPDLLRRIRDEAGITSGEAAGALIGVSQAAVSRWENGRQVPLPDDADRYARALRAPAALRRQLVAMVRDRHEQYRAATPTRMAVSRSADHEKRVRRNESVATHIEVFHPLVVPALLQTARYIRGIFATGGLPEAAIEIKLAERVARSEILTDEWRDFTFVCTAGGLGWCVSSPAVMVHQIEHVVSMSRRDNIRVGVIPWGASATTFPPCGFDIYDQATVVVGVFGGTTYHNTRGDVSRLASMFSDLKDMAMWGDEARAELRRVATEYQRVT